MKKFLYIFVLTIVGLGLIIAIPQSADARPRPKVHVQVKCISYSCDIYKVRACRGTKLRLNEKMKKHACTKWVIWRNYVEGTL